MANTRAAWAHDVPDLYETGEMHLAAGLLREVEVSKATGLSVETIRDALSRPPVTRETNPLVHLSRPFRRVGNAPLWSPEQVAKANELRQADEPRYLGGGDEQLPKIGADEAKELGYVSTTEVAAMVPNPRNPDRTVHEQTVRRWARENADFPRAIALRARSFGHPGVPLVVYDGDQIRAWLSTKGIEFHSPRSA